MKQYLDLMQLILGYGEMRKDRTGTGTISVFGPQIYFDFREGFPLLTTKKLHIKSIVNELLWFISGSTNINKLDSTIWNEWADKDGNLGPVYGKQWRDWDGHDQLQGVIDSIKNNPFSRRHIVSAWNVSELENMALPPCHLLFQFYVSKAGLHCQLYQRSADVFLGLPFNIASYALLTHMIAKVCGLRACDLTIALGDAHIYLNHVEQAKLQLEREPYELPSLQLRHRDSIDDFTAEDIKFHNYKAWSHIKAEVSK